ncbi:hypothetical protein BVY04_00345 [bacterium M21]|nr:hypothetical protein BVY04_00345 [bacterium M21]
MIKHIVMWKLKDENKAANATKMKQMLEDLIPIIPEITELEVGLADSTPNDACSDLVLYSVFASQADLDTYQQHPSHQAVVAFAKTVVIERRVVDYTL